MTKEIYPLIPVGQLGILELIKEKGFIEDKFILRPLFYHASFSVFIPIHFVTLLQ